MTLKQFMETLNSYLKWYRDERIKSDLGYMNPRKYRESPGSQHRKPVQ